MKKTVITLSLCASIMLQAQTNEATLAAVTVTSATKSQQSIQDVTSNVEVITGAELEEKKIKTVIQALKYKGVIGTQSGGMGQPSSLFLRGFRTSDTLVLIDGVKYNDPTSTEGEALLEHLMISDVEQIEIIKGAQSGVWGSNAVAGVINIVTKQPNRGINVDANIERGTNSTQTYKFKISQKIDKLNYYLGVNEVQSNGISAVTPSNESSKDYERDEYKNTTINAKLGYDITQDTKLNLGLTDIRATTQYDSRPSTATPAAEAAQNKDNNQIHENRIYNAELKQYFNESDYISLNYQKSNFYRQMNDYTSFGYSQLIYKSNITKYGLKSRINYFDNNFFLVGVEKEKTKDKENDFEINNKAVYLTNSNYIGNLLLTQSLRHDKYKEFSNKTTGKVGVKYNFSEDLSLSANYGMAYKAPVVDQLFGSYTNYLGGINEYGNNNLKPETIKGYDFSLKYKGISVTYYKNKIQDMIDYSDMGTTAATGPAFTYWFDDMYINASGQSTFEGYELKYDNEIYDNLLFGAYYNKIFAKDSEGKYLQRRARSTAGVSLDYYGFAKTHLGVYANYVGTRYDELAQTNQTGRYTLVDAVINYDITKNFSTYLKVENATDKRYQEVYNYGTSGRVFRVGLNAKF